MLGFSRRSTIGFVRVGEVSSCSAMEPERGKRGGIAGMEAVRGRIGEVAGIEEFELTKESRGLPSSSGSGRDPNLELFEADRPLPLPAVKDPLGDIMKPAGEYPPDRAAELTSTIDEAPETCLEIAERPWEESKEDLRLSERFCSSCNSLIASSMEEVILNRSAVLSKY
jgi:hypothetical protein